MATSPVVMSATNPNSIDNPDGASSSTAMDTTPVPAPPAMLDRARALAAGIGVSSPPFMGERGGVGVGAGGGPGRRLDQYHHQQQHLHNRELDRMLSKVGSGGASPGSGANSSGGSSANANTFKAAHRLTQGGRITKMRQGQRASSSPSSGVTGPGSGAGTPASAGSTTAGANTGAASANAASASTTTTSSSSTATTPGSSSAGSRCSRTRASVPASVSASSSTSAACSRSNSYSSSGSPSPIHGTPHHAAAAAAHAAHAAHAALTTSSHRPTSSPSSSSSRIPPATGASSASSSSSSCSSSTIAPAHAHAGANASAARFDESSDCSDLGKPYITRSSSSSSATSATSASSAAGLKQQQQQHPQQHYTHLDALPDAASAMAVDDDAPVLTFWGPDPVPLPSRFARIKRNLIAGHEEALEASWARLIKALRAEVEHIEGLGAHLIPSIEFADMDNPAQTQRFGRDLRRYGVGVVRRAVPKNDADDMVQDTVRYLDARRTNDLKGLKQDPTCYDYFWTPAQVRSRAHSSVLRAQRFMMGLWETTPDDRLATRLPITYVDRIRIHGADGDKRAALDLATTNGSEGKLNGGSNTGDISTNLEHHQAPQSADDWVVALQSSAGVIAQVDNGSLERWEPDGYGRTGTYKNVFHGDWESYDPWECASRVSSTMDLYNGYGACTIFRMFQGVLALSTIEPGMVRLLPSPKLATAYYLLRPFFSPRKAAPEVRSGPEWEAYLDPSNWKLERDPDTIIHGAVPGHAQRITERWHPHLHLRGSMITLPTLQPGDYIFWHPDLPYHISSSDPSSGLQTPRRSPDEVSMLVYIPAAPLTQTNALYLARQRKAFQRGHPGPDFDSSGRGMMVEDPDTRPGEKEIAEAGGSSGLQAMGLAPWEVAATRSATPASSDSNHSNGSELKTTASSSSRAEAEVVRLSNIILFPDRSMMGYSV